LKLRIMGTLHLPRGLLPWERDLLASEIGTLVQESVNRRDDIPLCEVR
jgi:hypothetical protein